MDRTLDKYLECVEKYLKPMAVSERIDIVQEIRSEMLELQSNGTSAEQIVERLGNPKELAKAYLGENLSRGRGFSWRRLCAFIAFYSLAGAGGMLVLPITSISGVAFMVSGVICPVAGVVKFAGGLLGYEVPQIQFMIGNYTAGAAASLPISIVLGVLLFAAGWWLWKLTIHLVKWMSRGRKLVTVRGQECT